MVGSLPTWQSSLPRDIIHPKVAAAAHLRRDASDEDASGDAARGQDWGEEVSSSLPDPGTGFIPPHIYASTYSTTSLRGGFMDKLGSCVSGRGHTLKGRDAIRMRTAILRQTGFVEPETPGGIGPARVASPAIVVAGDVAGREEATSPGLGL